MDAAGAQRAPRSSDFFSPPADVSVDASRRRVAWRWGRARRSVSGWRSCTAATERRRPPPGSRPPPGCVVGCPRSLRRGAGPVGAAPVPAVELALLICGLRAMRGRLWHQRRRPATAYACLEGAVSHARSLNVSNRTARMGALTDRLVESIAGGTTRPRRQSREPHRRTQWHLPSPPQGIAEASGAPCAGRAGRPGLRLSGPKTNRKVIVRLRARCEHL